MSYLREANAGNVQCRLDCLFTRDFALHVIHWIDRADKTWQRFEMAVIVMSLFKLKQVFSYAGLGSVLKFA